MSAPTPPYDLVYLSPHPDDIVLSCPGHLWAQRQAGRRVLLCSVFTQGPDAARRRAEDQRAADALQVDLHHLGLLDAPARGPAYRDLLGICFGFDPADHQTLQTLQARLQPLTSPATTLVAPLGVGTHIDHRLCHAAARLLPDAPALLFYADQPYAAVAHATAARLAALAHTRAPAPHAHAQALFGAPYARAFLPPADRPACRAALSRSLAPTLPPLTLTPTRHAAHPDAAALIALYPSQLAPLFNPALPLAAQLPSHEHLYQPHRLR